MFGRLTEQSHSPWRKRVTLFILIAILGLWAAPAPGVRASRLQKDGRDVGEAFFTDMLEDELGIAASDFALDAMAVWKRYENTGADWNPLATTWRMPGSWNYNSVGVQNYPDRTTGIQATANTLALSYYDAIRTMLREQAFNRSQIRAALVTWSGEGAYVDNLLNEWAALWDGASPDGDVRYVGPFYNTSSSVGGSVVIDITIGTDTVAGAIDFTNKPGIGALCGAGTFTGTRDGDRIAFSFTSHDSNDGCTFDDGWVFDVSATISGDRLVNGRYSLTNGQSGTFSARKTRRYEGRFTNSSNGLQGDVQLDLAIGDDDVAGAIDFTNDPGGGALCGAGSFVGSRNGNDITFAFLSNDNDAGCTFDDGWTFELDGTLSGNRLTNGDYYIPNNGQSGTFSATAPDTVNPDGVITAPAAGSTLGTGAISLKANATDDTWGSGVKRVAFYLRYDGEWHHVGTDTGAPYQINWTPPAGLKSQQLRYGIHVEDNAGNTIVNPGGVRSLNFVASQGEETVQENWVPADRRAYLNQRALSNGDSKCSAASMAMVLAMNGLIRSDAETMAAKANAMYPRVLNNGMAYVYKMRDELRRQGATANYQKLSTRNGWSRIKAEVDAGRPVIVRTVHGVVTAAGHFFVAVGYHEDAGDRTLIVYDPYGRWLGTCCQNNYDRNTTDLSSHKGRWVHYDFDRAFGASNWLITARNSQAAAAVEITGAPGSQPDPVSDEPANIGTYEGVTIEAGYEHDVYLPLVVRN